MARSLSFNLDTMDATQVVQASKKPSLFARFFNALVDSRQRAADREIERFIAHRGGRLTDETEREISRRFGNLAG
jgi:predicted TIM-barrel fold metal-dependent hydrolase